jgi:hypothetical protein
MAEESVARVVLVRAVEEVVPQRIAPETLLEARIAAGEPPEGETWIARHAAYLLVSGIFFLNSLSGDFHAHVTCVRHSSAARNRKNCTWPIHFSTIRS